MKNKITKQSHLLGSWWGNLQLTGQHSGAFVQAIILAFSGTAAYGVISAQLHEWGYSLPFWLFAVVISVILLGLGSFVWRMSMPSTFISWNYQWWNHRNPLRKEIADIKKELAEIKKVLDEKH